MALRVVGAGLGRTGTHSLKLALEQLLGGPCYHMSELIEREGDTAVWARAVDGGDVDWVAFLSEFSGTVDWPAGRVPGGGRGGAAVRCAWRRDTGRALPTYQYDGRLPNPEQPGVSRIGVRFGVGKEVMERMRKPLTRLTEPLVRENGALRP